MRVTLRAPSPGPSIGSSGVLTDDDDDDEENQRWREPREWAPRDDEWMSRGGLLRDSQERDFYFNQWCHRHA